MSAVLRPAPSLEPMSEADLRAVVEIEESLYEFPWTLGNFRESLRAGYGCFAYREGRRLIGYAVLLLAAGEARDAAEAVPVYLRDKVALKTSERR